MHILSDVSEQTVYPSIVLRQIRRTRVNSDDVVESWMLVGYGCINVTYPSQDAAYADLHSFAASYGCIQ